MLSVELGSTDHLPHTRSPNYPTHNGSNGSLSNSLTTELCKNVKKEGILVFTIAFEVSDSTIKSLLEDCASRPTDFYDATSVRHHSL